MRIFVDGIHGRFVPRSIVERIFRSAGAVEPPKHRDQPEDIFHSGRYIPPGSMMPEDFDGLDYAFHVTCDDCHADAHLVEWAQQDPPSVCPYCGSKDVNFHNEAKSL